ncbi:MAG: penicillin-binding protein activator [Pseudomonadota bacterium]
MPLRSQSRFRRLAPSLFFCTALLVAGCATQPTGPVGPISTGQPRAEPATPPVDTSNDIPINPDIELGGERVSQPIDVFEDQDFTPPHLRDRDIFRAGVMLPFSDRRAAVREEAEGMLAAIELALFDGFNENYVLLPRDTAGSAETAGAVAEELVDAGADLILGPLFGANVAPTRDAFAPEPEIQDPLASLFGRSRLDPASEFEEEFKPSVPVITFSNDTSVAGPNTWFASITPEEEVSEIINYAYLQGYDAFAFFGPFSSLGQRVEAKMRRDVMLTGGTMIASRFYESGNTNPSTEAESFALLIAAEAELGRKVAVLVPERGNRLRQVAPLLAFYGVDTRIVKMLGLSSWNDPEIWREPSLRGAWFPSPPADEIESFETRYEETYGASPTALAAAAYDAAALSMALSADGMLTTEELMQDQGFAGVNGLFRFREDGTAERSLAIMEVFPDPEAGGVRQIRPAAPSFDPPAS